jgi:echinoderm microtubule-associated protein-like 6
VYHVAGVGIVLSTDTNTQIHNTEHSDDILCLDVHPEGHTVATGEIGKKPKLILWDANTGVTLRTILFHQRGICNVAFTTNGTHIVSVGMDIDGIVAVHNCRSGVITGSGKIGRGVSINVLAVSGTDNFITGGKMHVKFWDMSNRTGGRVELMSKAGLFGKQAQSKTVISAAYLGTDAVTGMGDGTMLLWKGRSNTKAKKAHSGAVTAMTSIAASNSGANTGNSDTGPRILTGGTDGMVYLWNSQLICMWSFSLQEQGVSVSVYSPHIQALAYREGKVLIGTKASEILEVGVLSSEANKLVCGHFTDRGEVWGLAAHPHRQTFATCGDDMTVRVWDSKTCSLKHIAQIKNKARAVEYSPDGFQLALGLYDGRVLVLTEDLEYTLSESPVAKEWIQTMAYAPNGHSLAVGSHDSNIYILETKNYNIRCVCRGHPMSVTQLDFSSCSQIVHSVSKAFDLLFWDANTGEQITSPTSVRDVKWDRWTCTVGWPVQVRTNLTPICYSSHAPFDIVLTNYYCRVYGMRIPKAQTSTQWTCLKTADYWSLGTTSSASSSTDTLVSRKAPSSKSTKDTPRTSRRSSFTIRRSGCSLLGDLTKR